MLSVTAELFDKMVLGNTSPVVVDFFAEWCGPCKMLSPIVEALSEEYGEKAAFFQFDIDTDETGVITGRYGIRAVPTLGFFKGGTLVDVIVGVSPRDVIEQKILGL